MRKNLYLGCLVLGLLFFTGCGSKSLSCTRENNYSDEMIMNQDLSVSFKNDKVSKLSMDMDVKLGESYASFKDSLIESVESEFSGFSDQSGISYKTSKNDDGFNFKVKINFNKLSDDAKKNLDIVNYENSYDGVKAELEDAGYSCK